MTDIDTVRESLLADLASRSVRVDHDETPVGRADLRALLDDHARLTAALASAERFRDDAVAEMGRAQVRATRAEAVCRAAEVVGTECAWRDEWCADARRSPLCSRCALRTAINTWKGEPNDADANEDAAYESHLRVALAAQAATRPRLHAALDDADETERLCVAVDTYSAPPVVALVAHARSLRTAREAAERERDALTARVIGTVARFDLETNISTPERALTALAEWAAVNAHGYEKLSGAIDAGNAVIAALTEAGTALTARAEAAEREVLGLRAGWAASVGEAAGASWDAAIVDAERTATRLIEEAEERGKSLALVGWNAEAAALRASLTASRAETASLRVAAAQVVSAEDFVRRVWSNGIERSKVNEAEAGRAHYIDRLRALLTSTTKETR